MGSPTEQLGWRDHAACGARTAAFFFPPNHFERKPERDLREGIARALCGGCAVRDQCLQHALAVDEPRGIWGGLNELERRRLQKRVKRPA
jgi:WhiB family redox-sensing transcriptional regulator